MRFLISNIFILGAISLHAQELIKTDWQQGYAKDGKKISVWQYFLNSEKEPELVINHTNGRVMFVSKDTTDYVIFKNGQWVVSKVDVHPVPVAGTHNFYQAVFDTLRYPLKDFNKGLEGKVVVTFDVDSTGLTKNYRIIKGIGASCDSAVIAAFKAVDQKWIPARLTNKRFQTRLAMGFEFRSKEGTPLNNEAFIIDPKEAKLLDEFVVKSPSNNKDQPYVYIEKPVEFIGGMKALAKWLSQNLRYPPSARRMGLEGKVTIDFIVETDGSISNATIIRGFDGACDKEAFRIISIMPKWKPAERSGRKVRQHYTLPVIFKLAE